MIFRRSVFFLPFDINDKPSHFEGISDFITVKEMTVIEVVYLLVKVNHIKKKHTVT